MEHTKTEVEYWMALSGFWICLVGMIGCVLYAAFTGYGHSPLRIVKFLLGGFIPGAIIVLMAMLYGLIQDWHALRTRNQNK